MGSWKKKNFVFISPHFPDHYWNFIKALKNEGICTLGIADCPYDQLSWDLKSNLDEYYRVSNLENYEEIYRAVAHFIHKHGRIEWIYSQNEHWLNTEAKLRKDFNIETGPHPALLEKRRRKSEMKKHYISLGINVAQSILNPTLDDAIKFTTKVGYPIIGKPDIGVGAEGCIKINDDQELRNHFNLRDQKYNKVGWFYEEFIEGNLYSFDGLVDSNGKVVFYDAMLQLREGSGIMECLTNETTAAYCIIRDIPPELMQLSIKTIEEFKLNSQFFHSEWFLRKKDGKFYALEINLRPPGGYTIDMVDYAYNIDLFKAFAQLLTLDTISITGKEPLYNSAFVSRKYTISYAHSHEEIFKKYGQHITEAREMPSVFARVMGDYFYNYRVKTFEEVLEIQKFIEQRK